MTDDHIIENDQLHSRLKAAMEDQKQDRGDGSKQDLLAHEDRVFLDTIWHQANKIVCASLPVSPLPVPDYEMLQDVLSATIRASREVGAIDGIMGGGPLPLSTTEARSLLRAEFQALDVADLRRLFLSDRLRRAAAELLERGETAEDTTDVMISIFSRLPITDPWTSPLIRGAVPQLRGLLDQQTRRTHGWSASINALAIILSTKTRNPEETLPERLVLYHDAIANIVEQERSITESGLRTLDQSVTNFLATLSSMPLRLLNRREKELRNLSSTLHPVMIALELTQTIKPLDSDAVARFRAMATRRELWRPDEPDSHFITWVRVTDAMTSASEAIGLPQGSGEMILVRLISGASRALLRRHNRAASSFYNAGVNALRLATAQPVDTAKLSIAQILFNGFGLWWAMELNPDFRVSMGDDADGGDCAVNLMGGVTQEHLLPATRAFAQDLMALAQKGDILSLDQRERITNSIRRLNLSPSDTAPDREQLMASVCRLLAEHAPKSFHDAIFQGKITPELSFEACERAFRNAVPDEHWSIYLNRVFDRVNEAFVRQRNTPDAMEVLRNTYEKYLEPGPLVAEGIIEPQTWASWVARAHRPFVSTDLLFEGLSGR